MRRLFFLCSGLFAFLLLLSAPQVRADGITDTFTFTESLNSVDTISYVWQLPASPNPGANAAIGVGFTLVDVPIFTYLNGSLQSSSPSLDTLLFFAGGVGLSFYNGSSNFGLTWIDPATQNSGQLYTGFEDAPTFLTGDFSGIDPFNLDANGSPVSASLSIVSTPEPSSLLLLFIGLLASVGALALKKLQA